MCLTVLLSRTHVRFPTHEIDGLSSLDRIPGDFSVSVNFQRKDPSRTERFPYVLPERKKLDLIFASKGEYAEACSAAGIEGAGVAVSSSSSSAPKRPPREKSSMPKPASLVDVASLGNSAGGATAASGLSNRLGEQNKPSSLIDIGSGEDKIVDNIFPEHPPPAKAASKDDDILLDLGGGSEKVTPSSQENSGSSNNLSDLLGGFAEPRVPQPGTNGSTGDPTLIGDLFGAPSRPKVPQPMGGGGASPPSEAPLLNDFFGAQPSRPDPFGGNPTSGGGNLLGDLLSPSAMPTAAAAPPTQSASERMVEDMLNNLSVGGGGGAPKSTAASTQQPQRPNYSSTVFQSSSSSNTVNKPTTKATFEDLLGLYTTYYTRRFVVRRVWYTLSIHTSGSISQVASLLRRIPILARP